MVAVVTGNGLGIERSSGFVLGSRGNLGDSVFNRFGENVTVNAATGNLVITRTDEILKGLGPDSVLARAYNSLGSGTDDNGDNWRLNAQRYVSNVTGTVNTVGSTVTRYDWDGSDTVYSWDSSVSAYVSKEGAGAYDRLTYNGTNWTWVDGDTRLTEVYENHSDGGKILTAKDTNNVGLTYTYHATTKQLIKVATGATEWTEIGWTGNNITSVVTKLSGGASVTRVQYGYDGSNRLTSVTTDLTPGDNSIVDGKTVVTNYTYDGASKRVASISQTGGALLTILYEAGTNRVISVTQTMASGVTNALSFSYAADNAATPGVYDAVTTITDSLGRATKLTHDASKQLTKIELPPAYSGAAAQIIQYEYNANGDVTKQTDALGTVTKYEYDTKGNLTKQRDAAGNTIDRTYDAANQVLTETRYLVPDPDGDGAGVPSQPVTTRYAYDSTSQLRFVVTAEGRVTEYQYDRTANLSVKTVTYPQHLFNLSGYASNAAPTESQLATWAAALPDRSSTQISTSAYNFRGALTQTISFGTANASGAYVFDDNVKITSYSYDSFGNLLSARDMGSNSTTFVYDGLGRITSTTDKNLTTSTVTFTDSQNKMVLTMANGFVQTSMYNLAGQLISYAESGTGFTTATTEYKYDSLGFLRMATDATGRTSYYLYDTVGRKVADVAADGAIIKYGYDADDRLVKTVRFTNKLNATQMSALVSGGNPVQVTLPDSWPAATATDSWEWRIYDTADRLIEVIDGTGGATVFAYDGASQLISTTAYANVIPSGTVGTFKTTTPTTLQLPADDVNKDDVSVARHFYDKDGRLVGTLDGLGYFSEIAYDGAGQKVRESRYGNSISSPTLRATGTFADLVANVGTTGRDNHVRYVYDGQGNLRFKLDANLRVTEYVYQVAGSTIAYGPIRQVRDYAGSIAAQTSYTFATVTSAIATAGLASNTANRTSWSVYDAAAQLAYSIDAEGNVVRYSYDSLGRLIRTTGYAVARATTSLPDLATMDSWATGQAANTSNRVGRSFYDLAGRVVYSVDPENYVTEYRYDTADRVTLEIRYASVYSVTDATTTATLASAIGGTIPTDAVQASFSYDPVGRLADSYDGEGVRTHFEYDALNRVTDKTLAYGTTDATTTHYTYDVVGRVLSETRGYGASEASTSAYTYDGMGRMVTQVDGRNKTTEYTYDNIGNLLKMRRPIDGGTNFAETFYSYDAFGNRLSTTDPRNNVSYSFYDNLNRLIMQLDAEGYATATGYNAMNEVTSVKRYADRYAGPITSGLAPSVTANTTEDATTSFTRDKLGRITETIDAMGVSEKYLLNAFGDRTRLTNKLLGMTDYAYDRRGLMTNESIIADSYRADGTLQSASIQNVYSYDSRGNLKKKIEASGLIEQRTTEYDYDKLDRLFKTSSTAVNVASTTSVGPSGTAQHVTNISYDKVGNVIETSDATGARTLYYYDDRGNKIAEINALRVMSAWTYDKNGNVETARVYGDALASMPVNAGGTPPSPVSGTNYRETTFAYDDLNRLKSTTTGATLRTGSFNGSSYIANAAATISTYNYYDKNGNIVQQTDGRTNNVYTYYDKLGRRIAQVDQENYLTVWTLDADGNVSQEKRHSTKVGITPVADRPGLTATTLATLQSSAGTNTNDRTTDFTYDKNGRRLTEARTGVTAWTIDGSGVLTAASTTAVVRYRYNALGQVTRKVEAAGSETSPDVWSESTTYDYDKMGRQISMTSSSFKDHTTADVQRTTANFYNGLNNLVRTAQNGTRVTTYTYDAIGQLSTMTDPAGTTRTHYYDAAGRLAHDIYTRFTSTGTGITEANTTTYDALGRVLSQGMAVSTGPGAWAFSGDRTQFAYNVYGEIAGQGINASTQEKSEYDAWGRVWKTTSGDGTTKLFLYDGNGNQTLTISSSGAAPSGWNWSTITIDDAIARLTSNGTNTIGNVPVTGMVVTITTYDKRGQALETREPLRETVAIGTTGTIVRKRNYNAFGEVTQEIDARSNVTDFSYNSMGRLIEKKSPPIKWTAENGTETVNDRPTETYYYDLSGRLVGVKDANGNTNSRSLLSGTGYEGTEALVVTEFHADGGILANGYDVFNDRRTLTNEIGQAQTFSYNKLGLLTQHNHTQRADSTQLIDYYEYDSLGRLVKRYNNELGAGNAARTDYDAQGRIISSVEMGGDTTTYSYSWSSGIGTSGLTSSGNEFGGWTKTTTNAASKMMTEKLDYFGRLVDKIDFGGHDYDYTFDLAGRLVSQSNNAGQTVTNTYYNTGQIASIVGGTNNGYEIQTATSTFKYDVDGNRTSEGHSVTGNRYNYLNNTSTAFTTSYQSASVEWDAMNRMTKYTDLGSNPITLEWNYDRNGNIRRMRASFRYLDHNGNPLANDNQDYWYKYDSMNRFLISKGKFSGSVGTGSIVRGTGALITYNQAGQRLTDIHSIKMQASVVNPLYPDFSDQPFKYVDYDGTFKEEYSYTADGYLSTVKSAVGGFVDNGDGTATGLEPTGPGSLVATYTRDRMGRVTLLAETSISRSVTYNAKSQVTQDIVTTQRFDGTYVDTTDYYYNAAETFSGSGIWQGVMSAGSYMGGIVTMSRTATNKTVGSTTTAQPTTESKNSFIWWDSALQKEEAYKPNITTSTTNLSKFHYDSGGQLAAVAIQDGRARNVTFVNNAYGQVLERDETSGSPDGDPRELHYYSNGTRMGIVSNNGTTDVDYTRSIQLRVATPGSGPFRGGSSSYIPHADFDQSYDPINGLNYEGTPSRYTVGVGDTLESISLQLWGDASYWYMIAEANGLSGSAQLMAGMSLIIPNKVHNAHNNTDTYKVYDPNEAIGSTSPTVPKPKNNKCGMFGQIILMAVAFAVTALLPQLTAGFQGIVGKMLGAALGSVVSQGVGVATGIQDKFSFKSVAVAALSAGVARGLDKVGAFGRLGIAGSNFGSQVAQGALSSAVMQGMSVVTGMQSRFDWAGVAAAGIGQGIGSVVGDAFKPAQSSAALHGQGFVTGMAAGVAAAAGRSLITGTNFGDNIAAVLPSVIGNTLGSLLADGLAGEFGGPGSGRGSNAETRSGKTPGMENNPTAADNTGTGGKSTSAAIEVGAAAASAGIRQAVENNGSNMLRDATYAYTEELPNQGIYEEGVGWTITGSREKIQISNVKHVSNSPSFIQEIASYLGISYRRGNLRVFGLNILSSGSERFQLGGEYGLNYSRGTVSLGVDRLVAGRSGVTILGVDMVTLNQNDLSIFGPNFLVLNKNGVTIFGPNGVGATSQGEVSIGGYSLTSGAAETALRPTLGVLEDAAFAQVPAKISKQFSPIGQEIYSTAAGRPIKTVGDLTEALQQGHIGPNQVPLDYVMIDGQRVIANTRSSTALINANVPKSQWFGVNRTGQIAYDNVTYDALVQNQLNKNYGGSVSRARR